MIFWAGATGFACEQSDRVVEWDGCVLGHDTEEGGLIMYPKPLYWYDPFPENTHLFLFGQQNYCTLYLYNNLPTALSCELKIVPYQDLLVFI